MIRRVSAKRFRAFEDVSFDLQPGATFVVGRNGSGKTSLMQAVSWALFGMETDVDPKGCIRGDGPAEVTVELDLGDDVAGRVHRVQKKRGAATLEAVIGGVRTTDEAELAGLLERYWDAAPSHLSRICFMDEHSVARRSEMTPGLERHLHSIFGLDRLHEDLKKAKSELTAAETEARAVKSAAERPEEDRRRDMQDLEEIDGRVVAAVQRRDALAQQLTDLRTRMEAERAWRTFDEAVAQRCAALGQLVERAATVLGRRLPEGQTELGEALAGIEEELQSRLDEQQRKIGLLQGRLEAAAAALEELDHASAECPVCLRELSESDSERARTTHLQRQSELQAELVRLQTSSADRDTIAEVRRLRRELNATTSPVPPATARPEEGPGDDADALEESFRQVSAEMVELREAAARIRDRLDDDSAVVKAQESVAAAYRRVALAQVTVEAFKKTIATVEQDKVGPLAEAMRSGWKALVGGTSELAWQPGGAKLARGAIEVDYTNLSGGERTILTVMSQLLAIVASTRARFLWLDEPLEHLDPDHRRSVAAVLAQAASSDGLRQIVVTTYEEPLVRRLRNAEPDRVRLHYLSPDRTVGR